MRLTRCTGLRHGGWRGRRRGSVVASRHARAPAALAAAATIGLLTLEGCRRSPRKRRWPLPGGARPIVRGLEQLKVRVELEPVVLGGHVECCLGNHRLPLLCEYTTRGARLEP